MRSPGVSEQLRDDVEHRLAFMLSPFAGSVQGAVVVLSDIKGPNGGIDKRCHLRVRLNELSGIVVEETEADSYAAVSRAADRAKRTLLRRPQRNQGACAERSQPRL